MSAPPHPSPAGCLRQLVAGVMRDEPALEAVRLDRAHDGLAVATLGPRGHEEPVNRLGEALRDASRRGDLNACRLATGGGDCAACPLEADATTPALTVLCDDGIPTLARVTCPTAPRFWRWRDLPLPRLVTREPATPDEAEHHPDEWKWQLAAAALCAAAALAGWRLEAGPAALACHVAAYVAGGWFAAIEAWGRLRERKLDVHFLMLAVAAGSAAIGAWSEGSVLLFLFSFSGALEHFALHRTQREIRALIRGAPKTATVIGAAGRESSVPVGDLTPGQRILVRPGELFPVDAEVLQGATAADESNLTGEATPVDKAAGDPLLGGTLNLWGAVQATVLRPVQHSALSRILDLIRRSQRMRAPSQRFTDRFGTRYTLAVLGLCAAMFLWWWLGAGLPAFRGEAGRASAFYRTMTLLVVASPCALVLSIPSAILAAIARGARQGILFRGGAAVEKLAQVRIVAMDKTGTLTTGELAVGAVESFPPGREADVLARAAAIEGLSHHPLARAVTRHARQHGVAPLVTTDVESVTGQGLRGRVAGVPLRAGRRAFALGGDAGPEAVPPPPGASEIWLAADDGLRGRLLLRDALRPASRGVVEALRGLGLHTVVLTGDRAATAELLRRELGVDDALAELLPEDKVAAIVAWTQAGQPVAMIGDGVNDAPSLAAAHVGVAMGARGSDAALEQADIVLMHDRLENFLAAFALSRRARAVIRQNLVLSLATVVVLMAAALTGRLPLTIGVLGHEGSTVVVVLNSLRLLLVRAA
ncbi:MAG: heavy metal translocating P-type ATPase [Limisphaerales bacterium]